MTRATFTLLALTTPLLIGCGDATGIQPVDLAGSWVASEYRFTNPANTAQTVDLVAVGGSLSLMIMADGNYTVTIQEPGNVPETRSGTVEVRGDTLTISESGQGSPTDYLAQRSGDTLTMTTSDEEFDFDQDGTDEPADVRAVYVRQ
jgi:hypothetical protein